MKTNLKVYSMFILVGLVFIIQTNCKKDDESPKPFLLENIMTPTEAAHGSTVQWDVKITNLNKAIEITRIHAKHECSSGWAKGQVINDLDLPFTDGFFDIDESRIIFTSPVIVLNSGTTNVEVKNTVTAYYDGGSVSATMTYKIYKEPSKSEQTKIEIVVKE